MEADFPAAASTPGATFPGISLYVPLGRGRDFSWSATATNDNVDQFVELPPARRRPPTRQSRTTYWAAASSAQREHVLRIDPVPTDASSGAPSSPRTITLRLLRSVHGPIQGTATVKGEPVAIARARSTYLHEVESALAFERLNTNQVRSASCDLSVSGQINFVFNWFYNDSRDVAYITSGWFPRRARGTDSHLPTGDGAFDWKGFDPGSFMLAAHRAVAPTPGHQPAAGLRSPTGTTSRRRAGARPTTCSPTARCTAPSACPTGSEPRCAAAASSTSPASSGSWATPPRWTCAARRRGRSCGA